MSDDIREGRRVNPTLAHPAPPSLELTSHDLQQILTALKRAEEAKIRFDGALHAGQHRVHVRWKSGGDQRDPDQLVVTKITRA